jgi:putative transposase
MRFALIDSEKTSLPVGRMCEAPCVSQGRLYAGKAQPACRRQRQDMVHLAHFRANFAPPYDRYGSPRMLRDLIDDGHKNGRRGTARLIRKTS